MGHVRIACILPLFAATSLASGISTHFQAADESLAFLSKPGYRELAQLLHDNPTVYRVGAIYPDWGYLYTETRDLAEDAHWPPFHQQALCYVHERYPGAWGLHEQRLFAFLAGMSCHGSMDDVWHFGATAFLNQAILRDAPDDPDPEQIVEVYTDFFVQVEHRPGDEDLRWWIPVDDLVAISHRAGYPDVTPDVVIMGTGMQHLGAMLEDRFSWLFFEDARTTLPWTHANYMDWWDGGVEDGADVTAQVLRAYWDEHLAGAPSCPAPRRGPRPEHDDARTSGFLELARELVAEGIVTLHHREEANGAVRLLPPSLVDERALLERLAAHTTRRP